MHNMLCAGVRKVSQGSRQQARGYRCAIAYAVTVNPVIGEPLSDGRGQLTLTARPSMRTVSHASASGVEASSNEAGNSTHGSDPC